MDYEDEQDYGQKMEMPYVLNDDAGFVEEREELRQAGIRAKLDVAVQADGGRDVRPIYHRQMQRGRKS